MKFGDQESMLQTIAALRAQLEEANEKINEELLVQMQITIDKQNAELEAEALRHQLEETKKNAEILQKRVWKSDEEIDLLEEQNEALRDPLAYQAWHEDARKSCEEVHELRAEVERLNYELVNRIAELSESTVKLSRAEATLREAQAKLDAYEQGVEVEDYVCTIYSGDGKTVKCGWVSVDGLPSELIGKKVRVLVMPEK